MTTDTIDNADEIAAPIAEAIPAPRSNVLHTAKVVFYVLAVAGISAVAGGAWPEPQRMMADVSEIDARKNAESPVQIPGTWESLSSYVTQRSMTDAMTMTERLKHESEQQALLNMKEEAPPAIPQVRVPLLPGRVARMPAVPTTASGMAAVTPFDPTKEAPSLLPSVLPTPDPLVGGDRMIVKKTKVKKVDPFLEDMATLDALQAALKELNAEKAVSTGAYRNDIADE